jgi:hypothetical protein
MWFQLLCSLLMVMLVGCATPPPPQEPAAPVRSGSSLLINVAPSGGPHFEGAYDFDLLDEVSGKACAEEADRTRYWIGMNDLESLARDPITKQAIAAAALDAIGRLADADTILITRVVADGKNGVRVCATVYGRAVRLMKAGHSAAAVAPGAPPDSPKPNGETNLVKP